MLIDFSCMRKITEDLYDKLMFEIKFSRYDVNLNQAFLGGIFLTTLVTQNNTLSHIQNLEEISNNYNFVEETLYPIIFATCEILKTIDFNSIFVLKSNRNR